MLTLSISLPLMSQMGEDSLEPNGTSSPNKFVHLFHSTDLSVDGGTQALRSTDPFLFYEIGRELVHRQFPVDQGVVSHPGQMSVPLFVSGGIRPSAHGSDVRFARDHSISCDFCHALPARETGAGQNVFSTSSEGRNTPHFFGAGLMEMIGAQIRNEVLLRYDRNRNGVIDRDEAASPSPVDINPGTCQCLINYGDLSPGRDGVPRLNPLFRVWYLNARGAIVPDATSLLDRRVAAFDFAVQVFGWGRGLRKQPDGTVTSEGGEATTIREIFTLAADVHMGLRSHDPAEQSASEGRVPGLGGRAGLSLSGAQQFDFGTATLGEPLRRTDLRSLGYAPGSLTEGDIDAAEFYMLNAPAPAERREGIGVESGRTLLTKIGCTHCHVESWKLKAQDLQHGYLGDRRTFRLGVRSRQTPDRETELVGKLLPLWNHSARALVPLRGAADVKHIYTDFKQWDIGPNFFERRYDGSLQRVHRTAPLWGVGSTAPYGHAGNYATLRAVTLAHGGSASTAQNAFQRLPEMEKEQLLSYLESLVLYPTDGIPADINGDGETAEDYVVDDVQVGFERFDPRFLFVHPPHYRRLWWTHDPEGRRFPLSVMENAAEAYQLNARYRLDGNKNGIPDVVEAAVNSEPR